MSERRVAPTADIARKQALARDPAASVWVAANAGSGKTHVLTERVLRLLLTGVPPESILCLTYTKAAAAEMRARVSKRLGEWALMDDAALAAALAKMEDNAPDEDHVRFARTLFAHALEPPGGLKINTIHAFCESVLHRFPLEAGVPFDFEVIEESRQDELIRAAREEVMADAFEGVSKLGPVLDALFDRLSDHQIDTAMAEALKDMRKLAPVLEDLDGAKQRLRQFASARAGDTEAGLRGELENHSLLLPGDIRMLIERLQGEPERSRFVDRLARFKHVDHPTAEELLAAFLTAKGEPFKNLITKPERQADPGLAERFEAERDRIHALSQRLAATVMVERSEALLDLFAAIVGNYECRKRAGALLDFNDLILATIRLLHNKEQSAWVRYKLDAGITHLLVDESQDTNPEQYAVVAELVDEFFAGEGAAGQARSLFAVGDQKQSIFSFQGAEPHLFGQTGGVYRRRAEAAGMNWHDLDLKASFRTLPGILAAVDAVFAQEMLAKALFAGEAGIRHESARTDPGGSVAIWPLIRQQQIDPEPGRWPLPADIAGIGQAPREHAERIVAIIRHWLDTGRPLAQRGRAIRPDDILILVQSRGVLFQQIIRALRAAGIPSPGADRLAVSTHIAIMDLLVLGDVLLNPYDDLGLATILRSPLFDVSETDLFDIASERGEISLWQALAATGNMAGRRAYERLAAWRDRLDFERPYEFFSHVLYAEGGLKAFHRRLGPEVDDVLAEFLDLALAHERGQQPSLQGFLAEMRTRDLSIKRDLSEIGGGVRVMTVHGAKGLEAPIVILADAATKPTGNQTSRSIYFTQTKTGPLMLHAAGTNTHIPATDPLRQAEAAGQLAEYWRKLYVAMTRAEDELHVTGLLTRNGKAEGSWYAAIDDALGQDSEPATIGDGLEIRVFPACQVPPAPLRAEAKQDAAPFADQEPPPLRQRAPRKTLTPSEWGHDTAAADAFATAAEAVRDAASARREGIALHALLQHLPNIAQAERARVARAALDELLPDRPGRHANLIAKAETILGAAAFAPLFAPQSRAEVPVLAFAHRNGEKLRIAGRIDRLVIEEEKVLLVDYKSDANPPNGHAAIPPAYIAQLGLYALVMKSLFAGRDVEAAILWTQTEWLQPVPGKLLAAATRDIALDRAT